MDMDLQNKTTQPKLPTSYPTPICDFNKLHQQLIIEDAIQIQCIHHMYLAHRKEVEKPSSDQHQDSSSTEFLSLMQQLASQSTHRPLAIGIAQKVGIRPLVMLGGVVVFFGLVATSYANSIVELTFTVGVLTAFGYGMISGPSVLSHVDYFDKKFAIANGIAFAGVSVGQLIFPPLTVEFIYWFGGWRGAIFVFGAIMLNICVCGALMRPLKSKSIPKCKTSAKPSSLSNGHNGYDKNNNQNNSQSQSCDQHNYREIVTNQRTAGNTKCENSSDSESTSDSVFVEINEEDGPITFTVKNTGTRLDENSPCSSTNNQNCNDKNNCNVNDIKKSPSERKRKVGIVELPILTIINHDDHAVPNLQTKNDDNISKKFQKFKEIIKDIPKFLAKCYGIPGTFKSPLFVMMIPAVILLAIGWYSTLTYQAARAISVGISEADASFLLSLMGIGSLVGRTGHGWFIDKGYITYDMFLVICVGICSICTFSVTFVSLYSVLAILAAIQGMTMGIANTLTVVMIKTCAKPNFEESAVGMLYLIWGIGDLIGGVFAGYMYDITGDYNIAFYFAGSTFALSAILIYCTCTLKDRVVNKIFAKWAQRQREKGRDSTVNMISEIPETEEYDNPVFEMDEEGGKETQDSKEDFANTCQRSTLAQIEIHDSWGTASTLQATIV